MRELFVRSERVNVRELFVRAERERTSERESPDREIGTRETE